MDSSNDLSPLLADYEAVLQCGISAGCDVNRDPAVATLSSSSDDVEWLRGLIARVVISIVRQLATKYL